MLYISYQNGGQEVWVVFVTLVEVAEDKRALIILRACGRLVGTRLRKVVFMADDGPLAEFSLEMLAVYHRNTTSSRFPHAML